MKDHVHYRRAPGMPGLVLGEARFSQYRFEPHYHLDYHIGVIPAGAQRQRFNGASQVLAPGRISIMPPGQIHDGAGVDGDGYTLKTFRVAASVIDGLNQEVSGKRGDAQWLGSVIEQPQLAQHLLALHQAMQQPGTALAMDEQWLQLIERLIGHISAHSPQVIEGGLSPVHWSRVRDYCHAHSPENITLQQLAQLCDLSRFQFLRRFKHSVGMTPHAWLIRLRLERACTLLARSESSIAQVAMEVGFYDQSHFNRAFRTAFGVAPSAY